MAMKHNLLIVAIIAGVTVVGCDQVPDDAEIARLEATIKLDQLPHRKEEPPRHLVEYARYYTASWNGERVILGELVLGDVRTAGRRRAHAGCLHGRQPVAFPKNLRWRVRSRESRILCRKAKDTVPQVQWVRLRKDRQCSVEDRITRCWEIIQTLLASSLLIAA